MLLFEDKKRDLKANRKPAWVDKNDATVRVDIDSVARLRKLKQTEDEKEIQGAEYTERLQTQYKKIQGEHSIYDWATKEPEDSDEDPITQLLKSNTAVFSK